MTLPGAHSERASSDTVPEIGSQRWDTTPSMSERYAVSEEVTAVEVDGEIVAYNPATTELHLLDRVATAVWSYLDGHDTLGEVCAQLADSFGADPDIVRADVTVLIGDLLAKGLVGPTPPGD